MAARTDSVCFRSSLISDSSCPSHNLSVDVLWSDIELAERYLVSNLFEDAAELASTTLHRIHVSRCNDNGVDEIHSCVPCSFMGSKDDDRRNVLEINDLIEAAGMVLIQAQNELGRADELIKILVSHFGHVTNVLPSLYVIGISLQISAGLLLSSQSFLEEYFEYWALHQNGTFQSQRVRVSVADLAEIYAVHVLGRGCMDPELALKWVQSSSLLDERKQAILDRLHALCLVQKPSLYNEVNEHDTSSNVNSKTATATGHELGQTSATVTEETEKGRVDTLRTYQGKQAYGDQVAKTSKMLPIRFHILSGSSWLKLVTKLLKLFMERFSVWCSRLPYADQASIHGRHLAGGVATIIIFYALLKERHHIERTLKTYLKTVKRGLRDFWQLAFGLQISPLVASQSLPVSSR
ncbi:hypothetical protein O6H91_15G063100 [Diphasiastrum complanatum]|uniref:Uncharacterized protein n=1 Tax=Diphasiastrum complanatum TaxID=34168 RepID=A0ACC2BIX9_DIPCM|nr:hypothetical protein O6H91_15G063100 [Diphasiastrum complanatum]